MLNLRIGRSYPLQIGCYHDLSLVSVLQRLSSLYNAAAFQLRDGTANLSGLDVIQKAGISQLAVVKGLATIFEARLKNLQSPHTLRCVSWP